MGFCTGSNGPTGEGETRHFDRRCSYVKIVYIFEMLHDVTDLDAARNRHSPHVARKRRMRIQRILRAALEVVRVEGRDGLTLKRVAAQQGLTTAALYRYFRSKDALIAELQRGVIAALARATGERVDAADRFALAKEFAATDRALLAVVVSGFVFEEFSRCAPMEFGILSTDLSRPEHTLPDREATLVFDAAWDALTDLAGRLRQAEESGALEVGEPSERAVALWAGLQGIVQTRKLSRSGPARIDSTRVAKGLVSTLLIGWGADATAVERVIGLAESERFSVLSGSSIDWIGSEDEDD